MRMILTGTAGRGWRAVSWPFRRTYRLLGLSWLVAFFFVGQAQLSFADDGLIVAPDLANGSAQTPFESTSISDYMLSINLSKAQYGFPYVKESMWGILNAVGNVLVYLTLSLVRGAISCLQWLLNLTLYRDNSSQIDSAVQGVAEHIFWPLLSVTLAIAGVTMYGRMRREGRGSIFSDLVWVLAATVLGMTFVLAPSKVAGDMDDIRTLAADGAMTGYSSFAPAGQSAAGFPNVPVTNDSVGASRSLANSMWNTYAVTVWCLEEFGDLSVCKDVGHDYLTTDGRWKGINEVNNKTGDASADPNTPSTCADELKGNCDWYRGQSFARLGMIVFGLVISIPLALMLLVLVIFGLAAIVGFLLLLLVAPFFLLTWMIPGKPRAIGVRWFEALIGSLLQSVLVTVLVGAVMVLSAMMSLLLPTYGLFMVGMLNCAMFLMAFKIRAMFENITGLASPTGSGLVSSYVAMKMMGAGARGGKALVKGGAKVTGGAAKVTAAGIKHIDPAVNAIPAKLGQFKQGVSDTYANPFRPSKFGQGMPDSARSGPTMDAAKQTAGPRAITSKGQHQAQHTPRPAGFPHSEPTVDPGTPTRTGKPGDVPAAVDARTRVNPSGRPTVRPTRRTEQTVPGAPPIRQTIHAPAAHSQVVVYGSGAANHYAPTRGLKDLSTIPRTSPRPQPQPGPEPRRPAGHWQNKPRTYPKPGVPGPAQPAPQLPAAKPST